MSDRLALVVASGLPGSGKSTVSNELASAGFLRINTDDARKMLFNSDQLKPWSKEDNFLITDYFPILRNYAIARNFSVVVDSIAYRNDIRQYFFDLSYEPLKDFIESRGLTVDKYFVKVDAKTDVIVERLMKRDRISRDEAEKRVKIFQERFEPVKLDSDITLLEYENNTWEDRDTIKNDLLKTMSPYIRRC